MASFDLLTWVLPYDGQGMKGALKPWQQDREDFLFSEVTPSMATSVYRVFTDSRAFMGFGGIEGCGSSIFMASKASRIWESSGFWEEAAS